MRLSMGLLSLVAGLAVMGYLARAQLQGSPSPGGASPAAALNAARQVAPLAALQRAVTLLEQHRAETGTYAGTPTGAPVQLVRADATTYCIEASGLHVAGPGLGPEPGRC
jgi:Tfp pilus assembly protein PilE